MYFSGNIISMEKVNIMEEMKVDDEENPLYENPVEKAAWENFGIKYLFPWQRLVISNILEAYEYHNIYSNLTDEEKVIFNRENSDSFCKGRQIVLLPTGAGKSLCFQIPAFLLDGPTLIIYPLIALMTDQQRRMEDGSLKSVIFRGGQSDAERQSNFEKIKEGAKIILANPEVLENEKLVNQLMGANIKHIAIDEAHTVAEWGKTFRPSYLNLGKVIERINPPVITAFTATASPEVLSSVSEILFGGEVHVVRSESDRQNIHYFVRKTAAKKKEVLNLIATEQHPLIVFCGTRNLAEDMCSEINMFFGKGTSLFYHAGLEKKEKENVEKWFFQSKEGVLTSTCAFGMGIDKRDIKTVVHLAITDSHIESYVQEAGRGGRDGSVAKAFLLWSLEDSQKYSLYDKKSRERAMYNFAETTDCRRQVMLDILGGEEAVCSGCDLCNARVELKKIQKLPPKQQKKAMKAHNKKRFISDWEKALQLVKKNPNFFTRESFEEDLFRRFSNESIKQHGRNMWTHKDITEIVQQLMNSQKIAVRGGIRWKNRLYAVSK